MAGDTRISTRRFALWTQLFKGWLSAKFASINIDTTELAKQGNNPNATNTAILAACNPNIATDADVDAFLDTVLIDYE